MIQFKNHIEKNHNKPWFQAILHLIDKNETSGFAENESYHQFVVSHYPDEFIQLYFFNIGLQRNPNLLKFLNKQLPIDSYMKSLSFHSWMQ